MFSLEICLGISICFLIHQIDAFVQYLEDSGCTEREDRAVYMNEDATACIKRVEWLSKSNQCVGFVAPLNENGLPHKDYFPATSMHTVSEYFKKNPKAGYLYAIVATPLTTKAAPFVLGLFGSDNKFTHEEVAKR